MFSFSYEQDLDHCDPKYDEKYLRQIISQISQLYKYSMDNLITQQCIKFLTTPDSDLSSSDLKIRNMTEADLIKGKMPSMQSNAYYLTILEPEIKALFDHLEIIKSQYERRFGITLSPNNTNENLYYMYAVVNTWKEIRAVLLNKKDDEQFKMEA